VTPLQPRTPEFFRCEVLRTRYPGRPYVRTIFSFGRVALKDVARRRRSPVDPRESARAALAWLCRAQDKSGDGGVSYGLSLLLGWRPSYVETSGYIIVTLLRYAPRFPDLDLFGRAIKIAEWLIGEQKADGSFGNPRFGDEGIVFDTGQVLLGLVQVFEETKDPRFERAANRAADWLVAVADRDGRWTRNEHLGVPHVYNTRTAWALASSFPLGDAASRERIVRANCDWALAQERDGWFENNAFEPGAPPYTHTIGYNIRGLQKCGELLGDESYVNGARRALSALLPLLRDDGFLPGRIDTAGRPRADYACLTGNVQLAICWAAQYHMAADARFRDAAVRSFRYVQSTQLLASEDDDVRGAIKGSHPIWGGYSPFTYPNWAAKFFLDALAECERWM
jgi:hypothetical protein